MTLSFLPIDAPLSRYELQAEELLGAHTRGLPDAIAVLRETLPVFLDADIPWKSREVADHEILAYPLAIDEARLAVARGYGFANWSALVQTVHDVQQRGSSVREFELAAEAVIDGDADTLTRMLRDNPQLVYERSARITCHEPAAHRATLLHYLAANGLENYRQRSPQNAVEIARLLLDAGAEVDALAELYGGQCACLSLLVSSSPPADAGVQVPLVHVLADYGANLDGAGASAWRSPLNTALVFGFHDAARALVQRGARVDSIALAAGLGDVDACRTMLLAATVADRHRALALAVENDQLDAVRLLLEHGESAARFNPEGMHAHQTPLHSAAHRGNLALVQLLLDYGAPLTIEDSLWHATPLQWAEHAAQLHVVDFLRTR